uniref:Uncharacterized protein n=1 Tax=Rhodopseudomonas palustris (strain BisA53) TaxID=316055 RepID=Q07TL7_RHOP5
MTRTIVLLALGCTMIAGASALSIVGSDSIPMLKSSESSVAPRGPIANRDAKTDKLPVLTAKLAVAPEPTAIEPAAIEPAAIDPATTASTEAQLNEPLRQAFAADSPVTLPEAVTSAAETASAPAKPKVAVKPPAPKTYALLSDPQIAAIKTRLNLSSSQAYYWPSVEDALRAVARKLNAAKQANPRGGTPPIDPDSEEVQQLKSAAMPLLFQLRDDQKQEVRSLARIIGLHQVAAAI